jgi:glycosyltransferase involved in cell wall biosynthesis
VRVLTVGNLWPPAGGGGYERIWASGVEALQAAGHEVTILTTDAPAPPDDAVRELRWYHRDGGWERPGMLGVRAIERHNARVLDRVLPGHDAVVYWNLGGLPLSLVGRVHDAGVPAVGVVGDGWMVYGPKVDPRGAEARLDGVRWLFISRFVARRSGHPDGEVVHPGVDPQRFPSSPPPADWGGRIAYVGREDPRKGIATARAAVEQVDGVTLAVSAPGDGDPLDAYRAADAVVFPVEWKEPWGLVPLEAMSVGRPVLATGTGGSAEYLRGWENCVLFPPGDAAALAAAIRRLAADAELRARLVEGGRATAARYTDAAFRAAVVAAVESR